MNSQFGTQLPRRKEQSLKCGITQIFGGGPVRPGNGERVQKAFVRVANPKPRLRREPIESSQPLRGRFESRIIEDFGLLRLAFDAACQLPLVTVPLPDGLVALAFGEQAEPDAVIAQFKNEPRNSGVRHAKLFPVGSFARPVFAQVRQQAVAQFFDGQRRSLRPVNQQIVWRRIAQKVKSMAEKRQGRRPGKELRPIKRVIFAVEQLQTVSEHEF